MAGPGPHVPISPPVRPASQQQILLVGGADQVLEAHPVDLLGRGGGGLQEALQRLVTDFVGELEALDQAVADLLVMDVLPITGQTRFQAGDGLLQEGKVDGSFAHAALGLPDGSSDFSSCR